VALDAAILKVCFRSRGRIRTLEKISIWASDDEDQRSKRYEVTPIVTRGT
jgi:hypothetical protein